MPSARWPALRPIVTTKNHVWLVSASSMKVMTIFEPTSRAVSKPKVGMPSGRGRSLSIVFGTCTVRTARPISSHAYWATR